jgi:hypothetical protein
MYWILVFAIMAYSSGSMKRICSKCKFYIPATYNEGYDIGSYLGRCSKFTEFDKYTQETVFRFAVKARFHESECGSDGKYFSNGTNVAYFDNMI